MTCLVCIKDLLLGDTIISHVSWSYLFVWAFLTISFIMIYLIVKAIYIYLTQSLAFHFILFIRQRLVQPSFIHTRIAMLILYIRKLCHPWQNKLDSVFSFYPICCICQCLFQNYLCIFVIWLMLCHGRISAYWLIWPLVTELILLL